MDRKEQMRDLMQQIYAAHKEFALVWEASKAANFRPSPVYDISNLSAADQAELFRANGRAYADAEPAAQRLGDLLQLFFDSYLGPVFPGFENGDSGAVDSILDFLEIDIPAFRLGYEKERLYRRLKLIPLTEAHIERLRRIALGQCASSYYRREIRYIASLMIRVADAPFVLELQNLSENPSELVRRKAIRMLTVIMHSRPDLRQVVPGFSFS